MPVIDFEKEIDRLIEVRTNLHVGALLEELNLLGAWPPEQLSELLQQLCWFGGNRWPTALCLMGADPNYVDDEGQTALSICIHAVCESEKRPVDTFETACELLQNGASPDSTYLSMSSVTHLALSCQLPEFVALFLLAGADVDREEPDCQSDRTLREELLSSTTGWAKRLVSIAEKSKV